MRLGYLSLSLGVTTLHITLVMFIYMVTMLLDWLWLVSTAWHAHGDKLSKSCRGSFNWWFLAALDHTFEPFSLQGGSFNKWILEECCPPWLLQAIVSGMSKYNTINLKMGKLNQIKFAEGHLSSQKVFRLHIMFFMEAFCYHVK